jgi:hypothetical protein
MWRVDDAATASVNTHMADAAVEENQIAELQISPCHWPTLVVLLSRRMRQADPN